MTLPQAIHRRLDLLAELAADVNASRAEIIAMLISEADLDGASLERRVIAYRKKTVGDVLPTADGLSDAEVAENVVTFPVRQPGRPRVRSDAS
jgi:hypothetical protein